MMWQTGKWGGGRTVSLGVTSNNLMLSNWSVSFQHERLPLRKEREKKIYWKHCMNVIVTLSQSQMRAIRSRSQRLSNAGYGYNTNSELLDSTFIAFCGIFDLIVLILFYSIKMSHWSHGTTFRGFHESEAGRSESTCLNTLIVTTFSNVTNHAVETGVCVRHLAETCILSRPFFLLVPQLLLNKALLSS